jgi:hypothetical protein
VRAPAPSHGAGREGIGPLSLVYDMACAETGIDARGEGADAQGRGPTHPEEGVSGPGGADHGQDVGLHRLGQLGPRGPLLPMGLWGPQDRNCAR